MDITVLYFLTMLALSVLFISYRFRAPYLSVLAGIILVFLGIFLSVDGNITKTFCEFNVNSSAIECVNTVLPTFSFWNEVVVAIGGILMFLGVGVILDNYIKVGERDMS